MSMGEKRAGIFLLKNWNNRERRGRRKERSEKMAFNKSGLESGGGRWKNAIPGEDEGPFVWVNFE